MVNSQVKRCYTCDPNALALVMKSGTDWYTGRCKWAGSRQSVPFSLFFQGEQKVQNVLDCILYT